MYSNKKNILQLTALLRAHDITTAVVCPGSRNAPIVQTLAAAGMDCHAVTDERSAGFYAIGLSVALARPVVVCCTSGSALLNLHPAVAEACYRQVPIIIVSADRPAAWIGQMDGQTLPQPNVFGTLVKMSVSLPEVSDDEDEWYCNRLLNEALLATAYHGQGPVHINVPIGEPLFDFTCTQLPTVRKITRMTISGKGDTRLNELADRLNGCARKMVVIGQMNPGDALGGCTRTAMCDSMAWLIEHTGNAAAPWRCIDNYDAVLCGMDEEELTMAAPDILLTCGGHIISKRFKQFIRRHHPAEHWHITPDGKIADTFCCLTRVIEMQPRDFFAALSPLLDGNGSTYAAGWSKRSREMRKAVFGYSAMSAAGSLMARLPEGCVLHLANSSAVRYAQLFDLGAGIEVYSNRGTNGIEGSLSTAMGHAAADASRPNFVIIGDLSFFYDMNCLGIEGGKGNLRIMLINNGCGEIFSTLKGLDTAREGKPYITGTHSMSAEGWARQAGFDYVAAHDARSLDEAVDRLTDERTDGRPVLAEVFTSDAEDVTMLKSYYRTLKKK